MREPFNLEYYPFIYKTMTGMNMLSFKDKNDYLRNIVFSYLFFINHLIEMKITIHQDKRKDFNIGDIEGYI